LFGGNNNTTQTTGSALFGGANTATANNSTGFGGFGSTNTAQQPATTGFGATNTGGGLFGTQQNKPAGGMFGSAPAANTGGFGSTNTSTGGGLFGANNTSANSGFGANNTASTGGGLFGSQNNNNNTAAKPAFGGFGQAGTTTGFGATANNNTGGGLFGNNANTNANTGGLFGSNNNAQQQNSNPFGGSTNTGGGLFGSANNQAKPASGGLFGSTPAASNTGGGLFGNTNNNQQQSGGLFGSQPANNTGGGLFGNNNNQNKPATGGLFGSAPANNNTGGGLFGNNANANTNTGGGLFGSTTNTNNAGGSSLFGNNNNKPAGGLFGGSTTNNNSGSLFGGGLGANNQQQASGGGSLFGSTNQQNNTNGNSMFGSMNQSSNLNQPSQLTASLTISPYGNDQLFSSLGQSSAPIGPLATPLAGARPTPARTPSLLSSSRLNSPIYTPRASTASRPGGYGFSYSAYGTPGSAYSVSLTPQASSLLKPTGSLGSALTSRLAKSMSMNNLRGDTPSRDGDSLLRPAPGSASSRYLNSGSMRRLTIDRSLRTDLFSPPTSSNLQRIENAADQQSPGLTKKVSFDNSAALGTRQSDAAPHAGNALVRTEAEEEDSSRVTRAHARANGAPEMEQVNGSKSLTDIPEDAEPQRPASAPASKKPAEKVSKPDYGDYWTEPKVKDLKNMSRTQLSKLKMFTVGRHGVGKIEFRNEGKGVDLSNIDLDRIFDPNDLDAADGPDAKGLVCLKPRKATVYPNASEKPARGQALNVPSRIYMEQSWPRKDNGKTIVKDTSGARLEKHVKRLHKIAGTTFVNYDANTATWVFDVPHYTTYALDDDDETEDMEDIQHDSSELSEPPASLPLEQQDDTMQSIESVNNGEIDDTFEFKLNRSKSSVRSSHIPGGFDAPLGHNVDYEHDDSDADQDQARNELYQMSGGLGEQEEEEEDLFLELGGAVQAPSPGAYERYSSSVALDDTGADNVAEIGQADSEFEDEPALPGAFTAEEPKMLRSILKSTAAPSRMFPSPEKLANDTWEDQLQRTMSPRKRDRQALKGLQQGMLLGARDDSAQSPFKRSMLGQSAFGQSALGQSYLAQKSAKKVGFGSVLGGKQDLDKSQAFRTSMDLMNSLWAQEKSSTRSARAQGFEV
jgi:nuclear pore complex protein Nup98-Nup96